MQNAHEFHLLYFVGRTDNRAKIVACHPILPSISSISQHRVLHSLCVLPCMYVIGILNTATTSHNVGFILHTTHKSGVRMAIGIVSVIKLSRFQMARNSYWVYCLAIRRLIKTLHCCQILVKLKIMSVLPIWFLSDHVVDQQGLDALCIGYRCNTNIGNRIPRCSCWSSGLIKKIGFLTEVEADLRRWCASEWKLKDKDQILEGMHDLHRLL